MISKMKNIILKNIVSDFLYTLLLAVSGIIIIALCTASYLSSNPELIQAFQPIAIRTLTHLICIVILVTIITTVVKYCIHRHNVNVIKQTLNKLTPKQIQYLANQLHKKEAENCNDSETIATIIHMLSVFGITDNEINQLSNNLLYYREKL